MKVTVIYQGSVREVDSALHDSARESAQTISQLESARSQLSDRLSLAHTDLLTLKQDKTRLTEELAECRLGRERDETYYRNDLDYYRNNETYFRNDLDYYRNSFRKASDDNAALREQLRRQEQLNTQLREGLEKVAGGLTPADAEVSAEQAKGILSDLFEQDYYPACILNTKALLRGAVAAICQGRDKIRAIKLLRDTTGIGLREAKDLIEWGDGQETFRDIPFQYRKKTESEVETSSPTPTPQPVTVPDRPLTANPAVVNSTDND